MVWTPFMMALVLLQEPGRPPGSPQNDDPGKTRTLIQDLGKTPAEQEAARKELQRIGAPAIPFLKKAASDADPAVATAARSLLMDMDAGVASIIYRDWSRGIEFTRDERGHVDLTVPEPAAGGKQEFKTYRADSPEEFTQRYPDVARKYHVRALASPRHLSEEMRAQWEHVREWLGLGSKDEHDERDLERWLEREEADLQDHWDAWAEQEGSGTRLTLGVLVGLAGPTLRGQLNLGEAPALVVHGLKPRSLADLSGLQTHDIITRFEDRPVQDVTWFREEVAKALQKDQFSLDILRGGKPRKVFVKPSQIKQ